MDSIKMEIVGLKDIQEALSSMPPALQADILGKTNRDILNRLVKPSIVAAIPYGPKSKAGVGVRSERGDKTAYFAGITKKAFWLRYIEYGTGIRITKKGYKRGSVPRKSFLENVLSGSVNEVIKEVNEEYGNLIFKHLTRKLKSVQKKLAKL